MRVKARNCTVHNYVPEIGDVVEHRIKLHNRQDSFGENLNRIDNGSQIHPRNRPYRVKVSDISEKDVDG